MFMSETSGGGVANFNSHIAISRFSYFLADDLLLHNIARLLLPLFCCTGQAEATSPRLS